MVKSPVQVASRIAALQLVNSRWGLESFWNQMHRQGSRIPAEAVDNVKNGVDAIKKCSELPELQNYFTARELESLHNKQLGQWSEKNNNGYSILDEFGGKWESAAELLWSLHVLDAMPQPWNYSPRENIYKLTGMTPAKLTTIQYWIRGFEHVSEQESGTRKGLRKTAEFQLDFRRNSAWIWRCLMHEIKQLDGANDAAVQRKLKSILKNFDRGLAGATQRALSDELLAFSANDDFCIERKGVDSEQPELLPFTQLTNDEIAAIKVICQGRQESLVWLEPSLVGDLTLNECESLYSLTNSEMIMRQLELGVQAIWYDNVESDKNKE